MPAFTVTGDLLEPTGLVAGTEYVVQNQGTDPVRFHRGTTAITAATNDSLILSPLSALNYGNPNHMKYTYAATDEIRLWCPTGGPSTVVFHSLA